MTKKLLITLSIFALFANATKASDNNSATHDEGVVINGVRWATRNVDMSGTFAETPESSGMFFQWGRKKAWSTKGEVNGWDRTHIRDTKWYAENDPCPPGWRVPTEDELQKLVDAGSEWITQNGVNGRLFGTAPYQIFLPIVGFRHIDGELCRFVEKSGNYWGSTRDWTGGGGFHLKIKYGRGSVWLFWVSDILGFSVRCVAK